MSGGDLAATSVFDWSFFDLRGGRHGDMYAYSRAVLDSPILLSFVRYLMSFFESCIGTHIFDALACAIDPLGDARLIPNSDYYLACIAPDRCRRIRREITIGWVLFVIELMHGPVGVVNRTSSPWCGMTRREDWNHGSETQRRTYDSATVYVLVDIGHLSEMWSIPANSGA
jgi:hypothetical protein